MAKGSGSDMLAAIGSCVAKQVPIDTSLIFYESLFDMAQPRQGRLQPDDNGRGAWEAV